MTTMRQELRRLWHTLVWRGGVLLLLGIGALIWPEDVLIFAMVSAGIIAVLSGLYEVTVAVSIRQTPAWMLVLIHGVGVLLFGALTAAAPGLPLSISLSLIAGWMLGYAALAITVTTLVWQAHAVRWFLLGWAALDIAVALMVVYPEATIFGLLYFGAVYAAVFGAWQVGAGLWLRYALRHPRTYANLGAFAPVHS